MANEITPEALRDRLSSGAPTYLVDVREPFEFGIARLPGAVLVPLGQLPGRLAELEAPEGALVVAYCHHGVRSLAAAALLVRAGFPSACSLAGGIEAWSLRVDPSVPRY